MRIASGNTGNSRAKRTERRARPAGVPGKRAVARSVTYAMQHLCGQADAGVDIGVENVDRQVDHDDHDPRLHDDALHEREIALEDALVEQPADAGPGEDDLDDNCGVD